MVPDRHFFLQYSNIRSQCQQAQVVIMTERYRLMIFW